MTFLLTVSLFATILLSFVSTSGVIFVQSYNNNSNTTSQYKPPIVSKSPVLSDSKQKAIISAAMSVPGLKAWSNQWQYFGMDFNGNVTNDTVI
jgi:hypothetical protein